MSAGKASGKLFLAEERRVTPSDLVRSANLLGGDYTFEDVAPDPQQPVLQGRFDTLQLRPGLILHAAAGHDLHDMRTRNTLNPAIKIVVVVGGATDLSFGPHRFLLGPCSPDPATRSQGALVNLAEEGEFSRRWQRGRDERKVSLTLMPEWLESGGGFDECAAHATLRAFTRQHLANQQWTVSARARALACSILEPTPYLPGLQRLRLEAQCIELALEALTAVSTDGTASAGNTFTSSERRRLARLEALLMESDSGELNMSEIARQVGSNPTTLQALAKRAWGRTVFERLRELRLEKAYRELRRGASVAVAAEVAGYNSANNFATAFKRCFGYSPREARQTAG